MTVMNIKEFKLSHIYFDAECYRVYIIMTYIFKLVKVKLII